jgi:hypothetical protein
MIGMQAMLNFFRKIRKSMLSESGFRTYLIYAVGEIVLVVIGILIALQINNHNESQRQRARELQFLENLKSDLVFEQQEIERFTLIREGMVASAEAALEHFNGKLLDDIQMFNFHTFKVGVWQEFQRNNNTFLELLNSGNLTIISNDAIKNGLLNLDLIHKEIISNREHLRNDLEQYFYDPWFKTVDLDPLAKSFVFYIKNNRFDESLNLSRPEIDRLLNDKVFKNGFVLSIFTNSLIIEDYKRMKDLNGKVVQLIDNEVAEG